MLRCLLGRRSFFPHAARLAIKTSRQPLHGFSRSEEDTVPGCIVRCLKDVDLIGEEIHKDRVAYAHADEPSGQLTRQADCCKIAATLPSAPSERHNVAAWVGQAECPR